MHPHSLLVNYSQQHPYNDVSKDGGETDDPDGDSEEWVANDVLAGVQGVGLGVAGDVRVVSLDFFTDGFAGLRADFSES